MQSRVWLRSPILASTLLTVISFHWLFSGTAIGFVASALMVVTTVLLRAKRSGEPSKGIYQKTTRGVRIYLKTPRLRGLLAVTLAAAAASAMVIVNTVVIVRDTLGLGQREVALTLAAYGGGSMLAALALPRILERVGDRTIMLVAAAALTAGLGALAALTAVIGRGPQYWPVILAGWVILGMAYSASVTPSGRLLKRSANSEDRPALFAAQFALSHGCWLIAYPLAGQIGARFGQAAAFGGLAILAAVGTAIAVRIWPAADPETLPHRHDELASDHPHIKQEHGGNAARGHSFVIDDLHPHWPV